MLLVKARYLKVVFMSYSFKALTFSLLFISTNIKWPSSVKEALMIWRGRIHSLILLGCMTWKIIFCWCESSPELVWPLLSTRVGEKSTSTVMVISYHRLYFRMAAFACSVWSPTYVIAMSVCTHWRPCRNFPNLSLYFKILTQLTEVGLPITFTPP